MDKRKILIAFIVLLLSLLSSSSPVASSETRKLLGNETGREASSVITHQSPTPAAADEFFYNTSRQNIIVILIFWITYIIAYFIASYLVQLPVEEDAVLSVTDGMSSTLRRRDSFLSDLSEATSHSPSLLDSPAVDFTSGDSSILRLSAMRKRRSNLSRIMLLARPNRRFRSLPPPSIKTEGDDNTHSVVSRPFPSGAISVPSFVVPKTPSRIASASAVTLQSEEEEEADRRPLITPLIVSPIDSNFSGGGGSLLNFIVPEFTVTVVAISLLLQGSVLLPTIMTCSAKIIRIQSSIPAHLRWKWEWLSLELLCKWWSWLWNAALATLFVGIPLTWMLLEGRSLKNAPFTRRLAILTSRFLAVLKRKKLVQPLLGVLVAMVSMLLVNIFFGKDQSGLITINQWNAAVIAFLMTVCILSSLICIPLGVLTVLRFLQKAVLNEAGQLIRSRLMSVERQIAALESLHPAIDDGSSITPPASTRNAQRKIEVLKSFAATLRERIGVSYRTAILKQYLVALPLLILFMILFSLVLYRMMSCFLSFLWKHVLLQLPGIRFIDNIISAILRLFETKSIPSKSMSQLNGITVMSTSLYSCFFMATFSLGLLRLFLRSGRSVAFETLPDETRWIARIPLERMLRYLVLLLISIVFGGPVFLLTGLHDALDGELGRKGFLSPIVEVMPDGLRSFISAFSAIKLLGFSMMIWLILVYRLLLWLGLLFVGWKWLRELSRRLTNSLRRQSHSD